MSQYCPGRNIGRTKSTVKGYNIGLPPGSPLGTSDPSVCSSQSCEMSLAGIDGSGVTKASVNGLPLSVKEEVFNLNDAFMFNFNPNDDSAKDYISTSDAVKNCFCVANAILASQGIAAYSGAHYAIPMAVTNQAKPKWHQQIKFNEADKAKDLFPSDGDTMKDDLSTPKEKD